ncbi:unnamed protein product [Colias eurytheme]|nr:unnamed protein product [Colias eurytheme]
MSPLKATQQERRSLEREGSLRTKVLRSATPRTVRTRSLPCAPAAAVGAYSDGITRKVDYAIVELNVRSLDEAPMCPVCRWARGARAQGARARGRGQGAGGGGPRGARGQSPVAVTVVQLHGLL